MVKFSDFLKTMFAKSQRHGRLALYMPKPDKNDALNGLILGQEVLQKCSNFLLSDFGLNFEPEIGLEEGSISIYH